MGYGKRSADEAAPAASGPNADASADPWYGYYGYRPYGYGYHGYRPYGYGYYYGKRSAAAEPAASPEAEADPWYGYYGYGYRPYGYGYYGYIVDTNNNIRSFPADSSVKRQF